MIQAMLPPPLKTLLEYGRFFGVILEDSFLFLLVMILTNLLLFPSFQRGTPASEDSSQQVVVDL